LNAPPITSLKVHFTILEYARLCVCFCKRNNSVVQTFLQADSVNIATDSEAKMYPSFWGWMARWRPTN